MAEVAEELTRLLRDDAYEGGRNIHLVVRTGLSLELAVGRVAAAFEAEGLRGEELGWQNYGPAIAPTVDGPALLAEVSPEPGRVRGYWLVDQEVRETIVSQAVQWCLELSPQRTSCFVNTRLVTSDVPRPQVLRIFDLAARTAFVEYTLGGDDVRLIVEGEHRFRMAVLSLFSGHMSFVDGSVEGPEVDWPRSLAAVTAPLAAASAWSVRGFVKCGDHWSLVGDQTLSVDWPPVYLSDESSAVEPDGRWVDEMRQRDIEEQHLLDAFGAFVIPASQRGLVPPNWSASPVGDALLVQHAHPEAWFGQDKPDLQTLETARRELRPLLPPAR